MDPIQRVGVVGCGLMGSGIAEVCARAGLEVIVREPDQKLIEAGRARIERSLQRAQKSKKLTAEEGESALGLIAYTTELAEFAGCDLVVEAIVEDEAAKIAVFKELDALVAGRGCAFDLEHVLASDHESRGSDGTCQPGLRAALLQPGSGARSGGAGAVAGDE